MKAKLFAALGLAILTLTWSGAASADPLIICKVGWLGNTAQAQAPVDQFLRHLEKSVGIKPNSMTGEYHRNLADCLKYIKEKKPSLGVLDLGTYLSQRQALKLKPLGHMGTADAKKYSLVVRQGEFKDLAALKGKRLCAAQKDARFVSRVVLAGKLDAAKETTYKAKSEVKCLKAVGKKKRGKYKADAALVEAGTFARRGELSKLDKLEAIFTSSGMPGLTLVSLNGRASKDLTAKIKKALPKLCAGKGKELCDQFQMKSFKPARAAVYSKLEAAYK